MEIEGEVAESVEGLQNDSKERNFLQTVDLIVNLRDIDLSDPENRFSSDVILPNKRGEDLKMCVIADSSIAEAKELDVTVLSKDELEGLEGERDEVKDLASEHDYFLAEAPLMPKIGQILGPVLGPRGKMPNPFPPGEDLDELVKRTERSLSIKLGEEPVLQFPVGTEDMEPSEIENNVTEVLKEVEANLPKASQQIKSVYIKFTMSSPARVV